MKIPLSTGDQDKLGSAPKTPEKKPSIPASVEMFTGNSDEPIVHEKSVIDAVIKNYISTGHIERSYHNPKLNLVAKYRVPTQDQLLQTIRAIDRVQFSDEGMTLSIDQVNVMKNTNLLSVYLTELGNKNFAEAQGDGFTTEEMFDERRKYINTLNLFVVEWLVRGLMNFQDLVVEAFKDANLKNS